MFGDATGQQVAVDKSWALSNKSFDSLLYFTIRYLTDGKERYE